MMPLAKHKFKYRALIQIAVVTSFIQFTNALEYMVFNTIFTFMAGDFSVPVSFSGYVSGVYTFGAVLSGVFAFYWLDRFNKKRFLIINMALLGTLTLLITLTTNFGVLLILRFCAGLVGGTTMGASISLLINCTPINLRGKMLATVIASFSVVSIVGMPMILFLCTHYGWHVALGLICAFCLLALPLIVFIIPKDSVHSETKNRLSLDADTLLFASSNALVQFSPMLIIPILVPLMTQQLGVPQNLLPWLFFTGGIAGYLSTKITGSLISHYSTPLLAIGSTAVFMLSLLILAMNYQNATLFIILFLGTSYSRLVSSSTIAIQFPDDKQRAGFVSLQTSIMYLVTTIAFFLSPLLIPNDDMTLQNLDRLLMICAIAASGFPIIVFILQKKLTKNFRLLERTS
ncbi:MFS transporter [Pseudoalteromonas sp. AOP7-A1-14]|uniref:MFS transporter n=1 Tax=Pseudoalteromonas TaxID=53246 RepID=UPI0015CC0ECA|nr:MULTISPECIES: MFS transporter [Pseudoalteromonas]MBE0420749.1 MFS transporter [Pseudoalteromonas nigrifaciens]NYR14251.1 MFS transporter [Pseudoalteromonas sp. MIP2626]